MIKTLVLVIKKKNGENVLKKEEICRNSFSALLLGTSLMLSVDQISMHEGANVFSKEHHINKDDLVASHCTPLPTHPCHDDEEETAHTREKIREEEFEEKPRRRKKN